MPCLGFGTRQIPENDGLAALLAKAVNLGYRLIDTASVYGNESKIGDAIKRCGVPRCGLFITDKVWNTDRGYDSTLRACEKSLRKLQTDYLDLYLIHWPAVHGELMTWQSLNAGTWRAMERLYEEKIVRSIGVSNFMPHHLIPLLFRANIPPMVNAFEFHPGHTNAAAYAFSRQHGMAVSGWSPLGRGQLLDVPLLGEIARKHEKTVAQICIRWALQHDVTPITKSFSEKHLAENTAIFDFSLTKEEMLEIDRMPETAFSGLDPDYVSY